jgi:hypothetical protein
MFDVARLRQLARTPRSGLQEVTDAKVHIALEPGYLHNPDSGVKIHLNAKLNQHMAEYVTILTFLFSFISFPQPEWNTDGLRQSEEEANGRPALRLSLHPP